MLSRPMIKYAVILATAATQLSACGGPKHSINHNRHSYLPSVATPENNENDGTDSAENPDGNSAPAGDSSAGDSSNNGAASDGSADSGDTTPDTDTAHLLNADNFKSDMNKFVQKYVDELEKLKCTFDAIGEGADQIITDFNCEDGGNVETQGHKILEFLKHSNSFTEKYSDARKLHSDVQTLAKKVVPQVQNMQRVARVEMERLRMFFNLHF